MTDSKPLTPQEFEDMYLMRSASQPEAEKETAAERNDIRQALSKRADIIRLFKPTKGVEKRVQEYYDASFDRAFRGKTDGELLSDADSDEAEWGTESLRANGIFWGGAILENEDGGLDIDMVDIKTPNGKRGDVVLRGVINLSANEHDRTNDGQMNYCAYPGPPPVATLSMKPLSWKFAAINMGGATSRIHLLNHQVNEEEGRKTFLHELMSISVQIDLADYLFSGNLSTNMHRALERVMDIKHFISKVHLKEWSRAQAGVIFGKITPSLCEDEELMRSWLCRVAALRHLAYRDVGEKADPQAKVNEFARFYSRHYEEFKI